MTSADGLPCIGGPLDGMMHPRKANQTVLRLARLKKIVTGSADQPFETEEEYYFVDALYVADKIFVAFWRSSRLTHPAAIAKMRAIVEASK